MTFLDQLRDIEARAAYSTEPGRLLAEAMKAIADQVEATAPSLAAAEPAAAEISAA